jgi:hypothetical protein
VAWDPFDGIGPIGRGGTPFGWKLHLRRNDTLERVAEIGDYRDCELIPRFNAVGSWMLTLDPRAKLATKLTDPAHGIEVTRDEAPVLAGPVGGIHSRRDGSTQTLTVSGPDDMMWLRSRLAHPQPGSSAPPYDTQAYSTATAQASALLRAYVNVNAGPSAIAPRRVPGLTVADDPLLGSTITGRGRWQVLLELLSQLAITGGGLGFRIQQQGTALVFDSYQPVDRSATVHFSYENGTLTGHEYERTAPEANFVVVGGGGEGTLRTIHEAAASDQVIDWGRIESFRDRRDTTDVAELAQAAEEELAERGETTGLSIIPTDTEGQTFGVHYQLGDKVSAVIDGVPVRELIREVRIKLTPDGPQTVSPQIGTPGRGSVLAIFRKLGRLSGRVTNLERR